tara:strand:- start:312 stop:446 length:135 start_codon:yes stop_codon:yes gene_type:complete
MEDRYNNSGRGDAHRAEEASESISRTISPTLGSVGGAALGSCTR